MRVLNPDWQGSGRMALLTTSQECERCIGTGKPETWSYTYPAEEEPTAPGQDEIPGTKGLTKRETRHDRCD